jgi:acetoacetyl-CoA synthetase
MDLRSGEALAREPLWTPSQVRIKNSNMMAFMEFVNRRYGKDFRTYEDLYAWSIDKIPDFWECVWDFVEVMASQKYTLVVDDLSKMPGARWFIGARLNFAENLLRFRDDHTALVFRSEAGESARMTYRELYGNVARLAESLREIGVTKDDRVAGFLPNIPQAVVAMLATTSIGATWSSSSPDFGVRGVLDRFGEIDPKVLFTADGYYFKGKRFDSLERAARIAAGLPSLRKVVVVPYTEDNPDISRIPNGILFDDFVSRAGGLSLEFEQVPAGHPLYIMYSSGTTGKPKCMVQSVGGVLLNHLKELKLHTDVKREDIIIYYTTTGWMMWNWLVSSLALGATVVLYDGSPFHPDPGVLWRLAQEEGITIFGTSARYLAAVEKEGVKPGRDYDLTSLRTILSTGSPLAVESFYYVYRDIKGDVQLSSISGGADINGCFAIGNPIGPVYPGELQCRALGMDVHVFDERGRSVVNRKGELVCIKPSPSMPIYFLNDPGNTKYIKAYFDKYPGVWAHGDFAELTDTGGMIIYGRSDATLNPGGVRIGTAEIYEQVGTFPEIADSLAVGQDWEGDVRVILFVKMAQGCKLTEELKERIKSSIRDNVSPRHVPAKIIEIGDIPYTINMKKVEIAVWSVIRGEPVSNLDALSNPESLELYKDIPELKT